MSLNDFDAELIDGLEFCSKVYRFFEYVRRSENGPSRLRMRSSDQEKKLIEELLPICKWLQARYRNGRYISVKWVNGSQQFDAEIHQVGDYVEQGYFPPQAFLEVTGIRHRNTYLSLEHLDTQGYAFGLDGLRRIKTPGSKGGPIESIPVSASNPKFVFAFADLVLEGITKKTKKTYPEHTVLIVECNLNSLYMRDEWELLMSEVKRLVPFHSFQEIFLFDPVQGFTETLHGNGGQQAE